MSCAQALGLTLIASGARYSSLVAEHDVKVRRIALVSPAATDCVCGDMSVMCDKVTLYLRPTLIGRMNLSESVQ